MTRIKDSSVDAVKAAAEILPLVEDTVRLRKAGGTYKGLCPFHQERTPSFTVTPARGTFKCFGCGEGGDAIAFVEKIEGVDFVGAIEVLAQRFGIELEYEEISPEADRERKRRERLHTLLERATVFYERVLWESEQGAFAREYLGSRGLGEEVCRTFRLGYAPGGGLLARRALQEGYEQDDLRATGLGNRRGNDYFQRRLVFPLADARGRVRGFQARKLHEDDPLPGKYVNSPDSELFHKGDLLYGLDTGRQAIAKEDRAVVVEGNTDVIALRQAGFLPVVASMGTALTPAQLKELARLTRRLFLCFDADAAGQEATLRGMRLASDQKFNVQVVSLPKGSDPADDPVGVPAAPPPPRPLPGAPSQASVRASTRQAECVRVRPAVPRIDPRLARAPRSASSRDRFTRPATGDASPPRAGSGWLANGRGLSPRLLDAGLRLERSALAGVAAHPELTRLLEQIGPEHFDDPLHRRARAHLLGEEPADGELTPLLAELYALAGQDDITVETTEQMLLRLRERRLQRELADADEGRMVDLQQALLKIRTRIREFA